MIEAIALAIITSTLFYAVTRIDGLDRRIDRLVLQLEKLEALTPKRRTDRPSDREIPYYSPNSGIEL